MKGKSATLILWNIEPGLGLQSFCLLQRQNVTELNYNRKTVNFPVLCFPEWLHSTTYCS